MGVFIGGRANLPSVIDVSFQYPKRAWFFFLFWCWGGDFFRWTAGAVVTFRAATWSLASLLPPRLGDGVTGVQLRRLLLFELGLGVELKASEGFVYAIVKKKYMSLTPVRRHQRNTSKCIG